MGTDKSQVESRGKATRHAVRVSQIGRSTILSLAAERQFWIRCSVMHLEMVRIFKSR